MFEYLALAGVGLWLVWRFWRRKERHRKRRRPSVRALSTGEPALPTPAAAMNPTTPATGPMVVSQSPSPDPPARRHRRLLSEFNERLAEPMQSADVEARFHRDHEYENSRGVRDVLQAIDHGERAVMVVGRAGTGKTTLVHYLRRRPGGERQVILAPTGIAALNAGGQTIHSFFQIPPRLVNLDEIKRKPGLRRAFQELERVVIDEISMVRADLLDTVDRSLRVNRAIDEPFGGVQMLFVGDFLQLPPVVPQDERHLLARLGYRSPYAFSARSLEGVPIAPIELTTVHRQKDEEFIEVLGRLRLGDRVEETIDVLNARCWRPPRQGSEPVKLTPTNARADYYNREGLRQLPGDAVSFDGVIKGRFNVQRDRLPAPERLVLKVGARVMAVKNDRAKRWVNGSLGTVTRLTDDRVWVQLDRDGAEVEVDRVDWENIRFEWDDEEQRIINKVIGSYTQIPLTPAWAITIHKAQGLTLDDIQVDLDAGAFAPGQAYVALSRAVSLEGLSLARPIRPGDVRVAPDLIEFGKWLQAGTSVVETTVPNQAPAPQASA